MPNIRVILSIGLANAYQTDELEIDNDEWNECDTEWEREQLINSYWQDWADNYIDGCAEIIEEK